jgi:hypothetical protein
MSSPFVSRAGTNTTDDTTVIKNYDKMIAALTLILWIMINNVVNYDNVTVIYHFAEEFKIQGLLAKLSELKPQTPGFDDFIAQLLDFIERANNKSLPAEPPKKMLENIVKDEDRKKDAISKGIEQCKHGHECTHMPCAFYHPCRELVVMMLKNFIDAYKKAKKSYTDAKDSMNVNGAFIVEHVASMPTSRGSNNSRSNSVGRHGSHSQTPRGQGSGQGSGQGNRQGRSSSRSGRTPWCDR